MNNNKPIAIVLGGASPHKALIQNLKGRGYYTLLVDYAEKPVAKAIADEHIMESALDADRVLEIAHTCRADIVISTCGDQTNVTACYVAEKLGLPMPYNYETALKVTNKALMKQIMLENNIPTSKYHKIENVKDIGSCCLKYPIIVKPTDCYSSKGIRKISAASENIEEIIQTALDISRKKEAIIEEYIIGTEIGVDCFIKNGKAVVLMVRERRKINKDHIFEQQTYGGLYPLPVSNEIIDQIKIVANQIANVFKLNNTPLLIQAILNEDSVYVIEFGARISGGESYKMIKDLTGFDYLDAAIDSFLGNDVTINYHQPDSFYATNFLYVKPGIFSHISYGESLLKDNVLEYYYPWKERGFVIGPEITSNNRVGVFTVKSDTIEGLYDKINFALKNIEVYDMDGNPIMRRDIY
jgi:carbamoylphosphate synthase large subunit